MCEKVQLINHDCLPILMLLYIMLYIVLAYLMLFVCIMLFLQMLSVFMLFLGLLTVICLFQVLFCIMHSAFNLLAYPNCMFTLFFIIFMQGLCALLRNST